jgi:hypothetical protein
VALGGLPIVLAMLRSEDVGAINSALTVLFLLCITQNDIRTQLVGQMKVLEPLSHILENIPNQKTQSLALQVLTNLSVAGPFVSGSRSILLLLIIQHVSFPWTRFQRDSDGTIGYLVVSC